MLGVSDGVTVCEGVIDAVKVCVGVKVFCGVRLGVKVGATVGVTSGTARLQAEAASATSTITSRYFNPHLLITPIINSDAVICEMRDGCFPYGIGYEGI